MEKKTKNELAEHFFATYLNLRYGLAIIAATLPLIVYAVAKVRGFPLEPSISDYYWTGQAVDFPSRIWFVGGLFAVAAGLYLYKGFSDRENIALNLASILGIGVAVFPTARDVITAGWVSLHGFCAVTMFVFLAYVVWFRSRDTLRLLPPDARPGRDWFLRAYRIVALIMLASPIAAFVLNATVGAGKSYIFWLETAAIEAFATYWLIKSVELKRSGAVRDALRAELSLTDENGQPALVRDRPAA